CRQTLIQSQKGRLSSVSQRGGGGMPPGGRTIIRRYSSRIHVLGRVRLMSGGQETLVRWPGPSTATSLFGCPRNCLRTICDSNSRTHCSTARVNTESNYISTKASREHPAMIESAQDTAMNPAVLNAFALAIVADGGGGYPGVLGHEPDLAVARKSRTQIRAC